MSTTLEIFNEDKNINHHGFTRDVTIVEQTTTTKKLLHIAKFIGKIVMENKNIFKTKLYI